MKRSDVSARPIFLRALWHNVILLNYEIDETLLRPHLPVGTEFDRHEGRLFASLVAFQFLRTRTCGVPVPFHVNFPEANLRFYVRRKTPEGWRRGVVFIKEIVPRRAIAATARVLYNEPYIALPMTMEATAMGEGRQARYRWRLRGNWHGVRARAESAPELPDDESHATFILEHYFGYTRLRSGGTAEYAVEHPSWRVWPDAEWEIEGAPETVYGAKFHEALRAKPYSAVFAEGSEAVVRRGVVIA